MRELRDLTVEQRAYALGLQGRPSMSSPLAIPARIAVQSFFAATAVVFAMHAVGPPHATVPAWAYNLAKFVVSVLVALSFLAMFFEIARAVHLDTAIGAKSQRGGLRRLHKALAENVPPFGTPAVDRAFAWVSQLINVALIVALAADGRIVMALVCTLNWLVIVAASKTHRGSWYKAVRGLTVAEIREMEAGGGQREAA